MALLIVLWALACLPGLNAVGLVNWQESARALAAQQMQERDDWVVPTIAGKPYLAKPPMLYWCELALCTITGTNAGESQLRWTVALAGLAGVLLTYLAARSVLARGIDRGDGEEASKGSSPLAGEAALWSGAFLATGVLYVRSSRVGELDILLAPFTVAAVWGCAWAWLADGGPLWRRLAAIGAAAVAAGGAALTKGPPGLLSILLAVGGGIALAIAWTPAFRVGRSSAWRFGICGFVVLGGLCAWFNRDLLGEGRTWLAIGLTGLCGVSAALVSPLVLRPRAWIPIVRAWWSCGILPVVGAGLGALWMWKQTVESRLGAEVIAKTISQEASDNLRVFSSDAPIQNLEAVSYAAGLGSIAFIASVVWLLTKPPRIARAWWVLIAWLMLGLIVFGIAGRGTGRYLTPLWPGVAILGGIWMSRAVADVKGGRTLARIAAVAILTLALVQAYWYTVKRPAAEGLRSPREFLAELLAPEHGVDPRRLGAVDFWVGSLDFYAGSHVEPIADIGPWIDYPHDETQIGEFVARLRAEGGTFTLLVRGDRAPPMDGQEVRSSLLPVEHLASEGLEIKHIPLKAGFRIDRQRTPVMAVQVRSAR